MPQCQNSYRFLGEPQDDGTWVCPGWIDCTGGEVYSPARNQLGKYARGAAKYYGAKLATPYDPPATQRVLLGVRPQFMEEPDGSGTIYLESGTNLNQLRSQAGHEAFHMVATPMEFFHWLHEGLAEFASWQFMRRSDPAHASVMAESHRAGASGLLREQMLTVDAIPYPDHLYDQAFVTVELLLGLVAWRQLMVWADNVIDDPNLLNHLDSLDSETQAAVRRVLI